MLNLELLGGPCANWLLEEQFPGLSRSEDERGSLRHWGAFLGPE